MSKLSQSNETHFWRKRSIIVVHVFMNLFNFVLAKILIIPNIIKELIGFLERDLTLCLMD